MRIGWMLVCLAALGCHRISEAVSCHWSWEHEAGPAEPMESLPVSNLSDCPGEHDFGARYLSDGHGNVYRHKMRDGKCYWRVCSFPAGADWEKYCAPCEES